MNLRVEGVEGNFLQSPDAMKPGMAEEVPHLDHFIGGSEFYASSEYPFPK
jgi:hypothetical protein